MKKQFYPYSVLNKFRAYSKLLDFYKSEFEFGIQIKVNLLFFKYWLTIYKVKSNEQPKIKVGCINYPFTKLVDLLNSL